MQLIIRLSVSETAKLNHFLIELKLGDLAPSQLLCKMTQLGGDKVGIELLLRRLPESTLTCPNLGPLEALVATADKIPKVHRRSVLAV